MSMKTFFVGIKAVIVQDGKVLLLKGEKDGRDFWDMPGGRIDDDETIMQTLDRELHEELPNIKSYRAGELLHVNRVHNDVVDNVSLVLVFYKVENVIFDGEVQTSDEHSHPEWLTLEEALEKASKGIRPALEAL